MRVTYDESVDAAYLYLVPIEPGDVKNTYGCPPDEIGGMINLDFDSDGRLIGIEVLSASRLLPDVVLKSTQALA